MLQSLDNSLIIKTVENLVCQIMLAVKTAPKGRGVDVLEMKYVIDDEKDRLAQTMDEIANETETAFFYRDAENIRKSQVVLLLAAKNTVRGLNCGYCGFNCKEKSNDIHCVFNIIDLGIALGSAVSSAMLYKLDNRILYSAGKAALKLGFFDENIPLIFAIPFSISEKNIFFDRK